MGDWQHIGTDGYTTYITPYPLDFQLGRCTFYDYLGHKEKPQKGELRRSDCEHDVFMMFYPGTRLIFNALFEHRSPALEQFFDTTRTFISRQFPDVVETITPYACKLTMGEYRLIVDGRTISGPGVSADMSDYWPEVLGMCLSDQGISSLKQVEAMNSKLKMGEGFDNFHKRFAAVVVKGLWEMFLHASEEARHR